MNVYIETHTEWSRRRTTRRHVAEVVHTETGEVLHRTRGWASALAAYAAACRWLVFASFGLPAALLETS